MNYIWMSQKERISFWKKMCYAPKFLLFQTVVILDPYGVNFHGGAGEGFLSDPAFLKPNHFYLPKVIIQVQNGNGVLNRLVSCLKCIELACWGLQSSLDLYYFLR